MRRFSRTGKAPRARESSDSWFTATYEDALVDLVFIPSPESETISVRFVLGEGTITELGPHGVSSGPVVDRWLTRALPADGVPLDILAALVDLTVTREPVRFVREWAGGTKAAGCREHLETVGPGIALTLVTGATAPVV